MNSWIKFKRLLDEDFIVAGYINKKGNKFSIILGKYRKGKLMYKGHVTSGVTQRIISYLHPSECSTITLFPAAENEAAVWVIPERVCTVNYMPKTHNFLREAVFKGFRDDIPTWEVIEK